MKKTNFFRKSWIFVLTVILVLGVAGTMAGCGENTNEEASEEVDIAKKYDTEFIVGASLTLDKYIGNYKMSLAPQRWTIVKFDDTETLMGITKITWKDVVGDYIFVGTLLNDENGKNLGVTPHYIEVQGTVLGDDGYCDDVFDKLRGIR